MGEHAPPLETHAYVSRFISALRKMAPMAALQGQGVGDKGRASSAGACPCFELTHQRVKDLSNQTQAFSEVTKRYAGALLALADEKGQVDEVAKDMAAFANLIEGSKPLTAAITNPMLKRDDVAKALNGIVESAGAGQLTKNFVGLVAKNGRAKDLPSMAAAFAGELAKRRGEVMAEVTSARALTKAQEKALKDTLAKEMGSKVQIDPKVDPSILGGLIVRVGSKMVDSSLKTKLQKLKLSLSKGLTTKGMA